MHAKHLQDNSKKTYFGGHILRFSPHCNPMAAKGIGFLQRHWYPLTIFVAFFICFFVLYFSANAKPLGSSIGSTTGSFMPIRADPTIT